MAFPWAARGDEVIEGSLFLSTDKGSTWKRSLIPPPPPYGIEVLDFYFAQLGIGLGYGDIFYSVDAGVTWNTVTLSQACVSEAAWEQDVQFDPGSVSRINDREAWIGYKHGGLLHTVTGGDSWCEVRQPTQAMGLQGPSVCRFEQGLGTTTDRALVTTKDGGRTWAISADPPGRALLFQHGSDRPLLLLTDRAVWRLIE